MYSGCKLPCPVSKQISASEIDQTVTMLAVMFLTGKLQTGCGNQPAHQLYKEITAGETH